jgi:arylformamidase
VNKIKSVQDITITLGKEAADWPGNPPYQRRLITRMKDGDSFDTSLLTMTTHVGTHIDTPAHYIENGKNLDSYPIERWIVPAQVVSIKDEESIKESELLQLDIEPGDALLFKTANSDNPRLRNGVFSDKYVYMSVEAAEFCVSKKIGLVGIDYNSIDRYVEGGSPVHDILLSHDILILECINLKGIAPGRYTLFCLPMKIAGAEGAPARAVLVSW